MYITATLEPSRYDWQTTKNETRTRHFFSRIQLEHIIMMCVGIQHDCMKYENLVVEYSSAVFIKKNITSDFHIHNSYPVLNPRKETAVLSKNICIFFNHRKHPHT